MVPKSIQIAFALVLLTSITSVTALEETEEASANYRVLEWKELVPQGWEPPLIPEAYDEVENAPVDPASVVRELDQELVALPGFMKPLVFEQNWVSEFLLVPFLPHHARQHAHLNPNQMIYVTLLEPVQVENPFAPLWVVGTITLESVMTDEGPAGYRIADGVTTDYEY